MIYCFGEFELDEEAGELRRAGSAVALQPKPFDLLRLLIQERSRVVPTRELLDRLWPETIVTPSSLTRAVSHARRAIGDTHQGALLRSYARRGYRFCGEIHGREAGPAARSPAPDPLPADAAAEPSSPFVGREEARSTLDEARERASAGRGSLVIVRGTAGIGKTRLTEIFVDETRALGWRCLMARCRDGEGVPAYWLWIQVLRQLLDAPETRDETRSLVLHSEEIAGWLPELAAAPEGERELPKAQSRFILYDHVTRLLQRCASGGLLLVLEDVQWASSASLGLLEHLALETGADPLLVVATVRDEARGRGHPLNRTLSILKQQDRCEEVALRGLSRAEVASLLEQVLGRAAPVDLTSELYARTEGVPLFLREAIRLLSERGALEQLERIPLHGVRLPRRALDLIQRALDALSQDCAEVIGAAAVLGRDFALPAVAELTGRSREDALRVLDEATASGIVVAVSDAPASYRFAHALYQETAYRALATSERARLHRGAAKRLERLHASDLDRAARQIAHHHHRALAVGDPEEVVRFAMRAASLATRVSAFDQAAEHWQQALDALEHCEPADPVRRLEAQISLGEVLARSGERHTRRALLREAMRTARALERPLDFAHAAIAFCEISDWASHDAETRICLQESLKRLGPDAPLVRARIETRLGYLSAIRSRAEAEPLARRAVAGAREQGDPEALSEALYTLLLSIAGPDDLEERERLTRELTRLVADCERCDPALIALVDVASDRLALGDAAGARAFRAEADRVAGRDPHPGLLWHLRVYDTGLALLEGRFADAESDLRAARLLGERTSHPYAAGCTAAHTAILALERGKPGEVQGRLAPFGEVPDSPRPWVLASIARAEHAQGHPGAAKTAFERLAERDFADIPRNIRWTDTLVEIANLCADLGDTGRSKPLRQLLEPVRHHHGILPIAICYGGPVSRCLARLEQISGSLDAAEASFCEALESCESLGARPMQARILLERATLRGQRGKRKAARDDATRAAELAESLGMAQVAAQASRLGAELR